MGNLRETIEIFRRIRALISFAKTLRVDDSGALQVMQVEGYIGELRDGVERIGEWGFSSNPPDGSQAVVLALGGSRGKLVVIGIEDRNTRPKDQPKGSSQIYSSNGTRVRVLADGSIEIDGAELAINVSGDAVVTAGTVRLSPATEIDGIAFLSHTHISAAPGSPSGVPQGPGIP